jgi:metallopeptidase MepB
MLSKPVLQPPLRFNATPDQLITAAENRVDDSLRVVEKIINEVNPENATFESCILPIIEKENWRCYNDPPISFYSSVSPFEEVKDASRKAEKLMSAGISSTLTREELYPLVTAVMKQKNSRLSTESKRYLTRLHHNLTEHGFGIDDIQEKARYLEIQKRITDLKLQINKNFSSGKGGVWLSSEDLEGVPPDCLKLFTKADANSDNAGKFYVALAYSKTSLVYKHAIKSSTRRYVWTKDAYSLPENVEMARELFILRDEGARILGYPSYAAFRLQVNLLTSPDTVIDLLQKFRLRIAPLIKEWRENLLHIKDSYLVEFPQEKWDASDKLFSWDTDFYTRLRQEKEGGLSDSLFQEYFPFETTFRKLLRIVERLFQITFEAVDTEDKKKQIGGKDHKFLTWHEDVQMFIVRNSKDRDGGFLGYIYYDLFDRPGKRKGYVTFSLQKVGTRTTWY